MRRPKQQAARKQQVAWGPEEPPPRHGLPIPPCWPPTSEWMDNPRKLKISVPARSVKSTPFSNPAGPRRGCAAGQHAQHFGPFIPRRLAYTMPHGNLGTSTGPCHHCGYPQQIVVPSSPVNSGAQPEGCLSVFEKHPHMSL